MAGTAGHAQAMTNANLAKALEFIGGANVRGHKRCHLERGCQAAET
jgi:hypothetical protein